MQAMRTRYAAADGPPRLLAVSSFLPLRPFLGSMPRKFQSQHTADINAVKKREVRRFAALPYVGNKYLLAFEKKKNFGRLASKISRA